MLHTAYPTTESSIHLELQDKELWSCFESLSTEMILTKGGRRMFPVLRVAVDGLDPETLYDFKLDFVPCDQYRWRYVSGQWQTNGKQDIVTTNHDRRYGLTSRGEAYSHPKSPNYGRFWMSDVIEFKNVKLTNRLNPTKDDQIILNSLHKYKPRIHIFQSLSNGQPNILLKTFTFPLTSFIAVTAYQNEEITALKIRHNPFAKAFQEPRERNEFDGQTNESDTRTNHASPLPYYMLPFTSDDCGSSSIGNERHRSTLHLHRTRPYYHPHNPSLMPTHLMEPNSSTMFDYGSASSAFQQTHAHSSIQHWSNFQFPNSMDHNCTAQL